MGLCKKKYYLHDVAKWLEFGLGLFELLLFFFVFWEFKAFFGDTDQVLAVVFTELLNTIFINWFTHVKDFETSLCDTKIGVNRTLIQSKRFRDFRTRDQILTVRQKRSSWQCRQIHQWWSRCPFGCPSFWWHSRPRWCALHRHHVMNSIGASWRPWYGWWNLHGYRVWCCDRTKITFLLRFSLGCNICIWK